jgi:hypothetical protein
MRTKEEHKVKAMDAREQEDADPLESAVDQAIACDGDLRATNRALIVAQDFLIEQNKALSAELDYAWRWISPGYTRSANRRRMRTGEPDNYRRAPARISRTGTRASG